MNLTEKEIRVIEEAKAGNERAFEELYSRNYRKVYNLARSVTLNSADAADVLQQTFINVWKKLPSLNDTSSFDSWLQRITINESYNLLRKRRTDVSIDVEEEEDIHGVLTLESDIQLPQEYAVNEDLKDRLRKIIESLSEVQRETIVLFYYDELTIPEIAYAMNCSENTVKSRLSLARKAIKAEIQEEERKSGVKLYGIAGILTIPFGVAFVKLMDGFTISAEAASLVAEGVHQDIAAMETTGTESAAAAENAADGAGGTAAENTAASGAKSAAEVAKTVVSKAAKARIKRKAVGIIAGILGAGAVATGVGIAASKSVDPASQTDPRKESRTEAEADTEYDVSKALEKFDRLIETAGFEATYRVAAGDDFSEYREGAYKNIHWTITDNGRSGLAYMLENGHAYLYQYDGEGNWSFFMDMGESEMGTFSYSLTRESINLSAGDYQRGADRTIGGRACRFYYADVLQVRTAMAIDKEYGFLAGQYFRNLSETGEDVIVNELESFVTGSGVHVPNLPEHP